MKTLCSVALSVAFAFFCGALSSGSETYEGAADIGALQSGVTGAIKGYVKDGQTGEPVEKVKIVLVYTKNETVKFEIQTDKKGFYYVGGLTPGYYRFSFEKEGFVPVSQTWRVRLAETVQADLSFETLDTARAIESPESVRKAMAFFKETKWEEAAKEFSEGISAEPANPLLYFYRGLSQENRGQYEDALKDYQKTIDIKADFVLPYSRSAKIFARRQDYEKAVQFYQKALELGDQDITTRYNYAVVMMNLGRNAEATAALEKLLELDPDYADAYYHLGILAIGQGKAAKAKELLQKFLRLDPENPNSALAKQILDSLG